MKISSAALSCPECGKPLPEANAPCPACLFALGVESEKTESIEVTDSPGEVEGKWIGRFKLLEIIG